jgi:predicted phage baseplate assembly protein
VNIDREPTFSTTDWSAQAVASVVERVLARRGFTRSSQTDPLRHSLEMVLAGYCALLVERLNRAPDLHRAALAGLLGVRPSPAVPATVALAFRALPAPPSPDGIVRAARASVVVPRHTEIAAPATDGGSAPVVFQTMRDLPILRAELVRAFHVDYRRGVATDASSLVVDASERKTPSAPPANVFLRRALHIAHPAFGEPIGLARFSVRVDVAAAPDASGSNDPALEWGIEGADGFIPVTPVSDATQNLSRSGEISFGAAASWPPAVIGGSRGYWLTARMPPAASRQAFAPLRGIALSTQHTISDARPEAGFQGRLPLDLSRDFLPLGETPRFGDVFYLASAYIALPGAAIRMRVVLTNPADGDVDSMPILPVATTGNPRIEWDIHAAGIWTPLSVDDGTDALTRNGVIAFTVPQTAGPSSLNGVTSGWIRARFAGGNYILSRPAPETRLPPVIAPPSIATLHLDVTTTRGPLTPECVVTEGGIERWVRKPSADGTLAPFEPFPLPDSDADTLYIGVGAAHDELAGRTANLYVSVDEPGGTAMLDDAPSVSPVLWQIRGESGWSDCMTEDTTQSLRHGGFVKLSLGDRPASWPGTTIDAPHALFWLRIVDTAPDRETAGAFARTRHVALNAVEAVHAVHLEKELAGSSSGHPNQIFRTARRPLVGEVDLEVREGAPDSRDAWVRWACVSDFSESMPESRHVVVDRANGTLTFGDGRRGRIPPPGGNNVRVTYAAGGGARGNSGAGTVTQMRTTVPYVQSVANVEPAMGGQDAEDPASARAGALAWLRHRDRAVCLDDYADLVRRASPEVARALAISADRIMPKRVDRAGCVGVAILPRAAGLAPQPSEALLRNVKAYLAARAPVDARLVLFGPGYLRVGVHADFAVAADTSAQRVLELCKQRIDAFLHPLTGGARGSGWDFGQRPHPSDLLGLFDDIEGIDYVQHLRLHFEPVAADAPGAAYPLVCAGDHALGAG